MMEKRRVTQSYDISFDSEKPYTDRLIICGPIDTYLMAKEVMEMLEEQIQKAVPTRYHSKIEIDIERDMNADLLSDRRTVTWTYNPE